MPNVVCLPTKYSLEEFDSIAYFADCPTGNIRSPLIVDISKELQQWEDENLEKGMLPCCDTGINCNMMYINPWTCSEGLIRAAGQLQKAGGKLFNYGPFPRGGQLTPQSNVDFDANLRRPNPAWSIRDISNIKEVAQMNGVQVELISNVPSNNKFLTWLKISK